tara:strand:- start:884 stop:1330 length:447 start_codon:yes stop_codon:yes gene_type:complete
MGVITPTLTITANASTASTNAGPMSIALSLSATDSLAITKVESKIIDVDGTHGILLDASDYSAAAAAGTDGGFVYLKNITAAGSGRNIMIGVANENLSSDDEADRLFTLQPQEFAWFPWDCSQDIYEDANGSSSDALEVWVFIRTGTA